MDDRDRDREREREREKMAKAKKYDIYNPLPGARVIYEGGKSTTIAGGGVATNVALSEDTVKELEERNEAKPNSDLRVVAAGSGLEEKRKDQKEKRDKLNKQREEEEKVEKEAQKRKEEREDKALAEKKEKSSVKKKEKPSAENESRVR